MNTGETKEASGSETKEVPEISREASELSAEKPSSDADAAKKPETPESARAKPAGLPTESPRTQPLPTKDQALQVMERVLEEGLQETFLGLTKEARQRFRVTGEDLADRLRAMTGNEARPSLIHREVMTWLSQIPDANEFWLEQAGYIKTTKVIKALKNPA